MAQAAGTHSFAARPRRLVPTTPSNATFIDHPEQIEACRQGYPRLAAFIDSDRNFVVFRRFGQLHTRLLLHLQDEITEIEENLKDLDNGERNFYNLTTRRRDQNNDRKFLLQRLESRLIVYDNYLDSYYKQIERQPSQQNYIQNVSNWLQGNRPVVPEESGFLNKWDDLVSPRQPMDHGGLDTILSYLTEKLSAWGVFKTNRSKSSDEHVMIFDASHVLKLARLTTTVLAVVALTGPMLLLYTVKNITSRLCIIGIFTTMYSSGLCFFTQSRNYEIFTATSAYCAVMVVFVSNVQ